MIPAASPEAAGVDSEGPVPLVVGTPGTLHGPGNKASGVTDGIGTPPPPVREDRGMRAGNFAGLEAAADALPSSTGGDRSKFQPVASRERSVPSLCGKRKVWTNDRRCPVPCGGCEVLR